MSLHPLLFFVVHVAALQLFQIPDAQPEEGWDSDGTPKSRPLGDVSLDSPLPELGALRPEKRSAEDLDLARDPEVKAAAVDPTASANKQKIGLDPDAAPLTGIQHVGGLDALPGIGEDRRFQEASARPAPTFGGQLARSSNSSQAPPLLRRENSAMSDLMTSGHRIMPKTDLAGSDDTSADLLSASADLEEHKQEMKAEVDASMQPGVAGTSKRDEELLKRLASARRAAEAASEAAEELLKMPPSSSAAQTLGEQSVLSGRGVGERGTHDHLAAAAD